ncbi:methyltransferase domain-containing protein [Aeromicrobium sp. YIM 150415]|uniref:methyltransferase domain-containing protein n=1 Tax=Aeromicrobium sp. YIM 150415 TaxID=2803912 RepID=UPI0019653E97|nr:methyltransferase domain-containing protein [Aeromicrobium sp. YIM 150415]MBM9462541.1 methyltransferase domain-containing protein [Aeromicrobium sp. YIM 150415]
MSENVSDSEISTRYTHGHERATLASHGARTAANSAGYLLPVLRQGMSVLDVGCGPGTITLDLAEIVAPGVVVGIENVEKPLVAARAGAAERGDTRTRFELGDVMARPFEDDSFDIVHAHQVLQHLTDPVGALREMARVAKPGGWVAARDADYAAMAWYPELPELEEWRTIYRRVARGNGAEPDAARRMRTWAQAAGLTDVRYTAGTWNYADSETCRWWGHSQAERYSAELFAEQASRYGVTGDDLVRIAAGWRAWGQEPDAWFAIVNGELLARLPE